ncbi:hypothetical protein [Streptomyces sp. NPDC005336]|uniref:hypothetical protein n=1 Tax=Streptomyces sp. NPDC005336 TaxID=3157035 RepID=UPI00339E3A08
MSDRRPPTAAGVDPATLTREQLQGWDCALCGARLAIDRPLGTVTIGRGPTLTTYEVWGCNPACRAERMAASAWVSSYCRLATADARYAEVHEWCRVPAIIPLAPCGCGCHRPRRKSP